MLSSSDIRNGVKLEIDGQPFEVIDFLHSKYGRSGAHIWTKLRNLKSGAVIEHTFRSGEKINKPDLETKTVQYLYQSEDQLVFMDLNSYEQLFVLKTSLQGKEKFLLEGQEVKALFYKGYIIDIILPASVELRVVETEPGVKGDTVSGATKTARLESDISISVPLFINPGDIVKVDTRDCSYLGRG